MPQRKVKYLGGSHVRRLEAGEDFGGRLGTPLDKAVEWNLGNGHVAEVEMSDEALQMLLDVPATEPGIGSKEFEDVTDAEVVPTSLGQRRWRAVPDPEHPVESYEPSEDPRLKAASKVTRTPVQRPNLGGDPSTKDQSPTA